MRNSVLAIAPFVAAAFAQESSSAAPTVVPVISGSVTISSTYTYSNTLTNFLSLTNSYGVVTGMPTLDNPGPQVAVTSQPAAATGVGTQPAVQLVPAGLPTGINTIYRGGSNTSTSFFLVSVGQSTTVTVGTSTSSSTRAGATGGSGGSGSDASGTSNGDASATESSGASESSSAADGALKVVSGAVLGLGAIFVALL